MCPRIFRTICPVPTSTSCTILSAPADTILLLSCDLYSIQPITHILTVYNKYTRHDFSFSQQRYNWRQYAHAMCMTK